MTLLNDIRHRVRAVRWTGTIDRFERQVNAVVVHLPFAGVDGKPLHFYVLRNGKTLVFSDAGGLVARVKAAAVLDLNLGRLQKVLQSYGLGLDQNQVIFEASRRPFQERWLAMTAGVIAVDSMYRTWVVK